MADCTEFEQEVERLQTRVQDAERVCQQILLDLDDPDDPTAQAAFDSCQRGVRALGRRLHRAREALRHCEEGLPSPGIHAARGHVSFLRVHDASGFGPADDHLSGRVVFQLDTRPGRAFGFGLDSDDSVRFAHEAMLNLLRDAIQNDLEVNINYRQELNKSNSVAFRIELFPPIQD